MPSPRTAVIIATKGRPEATKQLLRMLENQTLAPSVVVVSATERADINGPLESSLNVQYIFGSAGLSHQRNRALAKIRDCSDIVIFFDDDFAPSPTWLEHCEAAFSSEHGVVGMSGRILLDGAKGDEISWQEAKGLISDALPETLGASMFRERSGLMGAILLFGHRPSEI